MLDRYGRNIDYLRISLTDRCNLRCIYCMPEDGIRQIPRTELLNTDEIVRICKAASELGISRIKLTGGEPLVRRICTPLVKELKAIPGICQVTLTTNGILLGEQLPGLMEAGLDAVNISLDTLEETTFRKITRRDDFHQVLKGLRAALSYPSLKVKLNCVPTFQSDEELLQVAALARENPLHVRFIEMMPIGYGKQFKTINHKELLEEMHREYPGLAKDHTEHGYGPAVYYRIPGALGSVGLISAIHGKFCDECNRVRLTSQGFLKTCLCYEDGVDLRPVLRSADTGAEDGPDGGGQELCRVMEQTIYGKPGAHCFEEPERITEGHNMSSIGG